MARSKTPLQDMASMAESDERILTSDETAALVTLDRTTLWRLAGTGRFPAPIQLTTARIGWRRSAVLQWLAEREANPITRRKYPNVRGRNGHK